ncbi:retrotransposon gag protein, partial [Trifolium medium]|nr:retrotransposon gag protein [Trifolium medium]
IDPAGWISRAEIYFRVQETPPEIKVSLAQVCMEGSTIHFFNSIVDEDLTLTWEGLKEALLERYGGIGEGDVYEQLTALRQKGTVEEYITEFEYLTAQIPRLPDKQFQGYFLHGLRGEIRGKVRSLAVLGSMSRAKLLQVARMVEREVKGDIGSGYSRGSRSSGYGFKAGGNGSGRTGNSDWVMVKGGQERGPTVGDKGGIGPKHDKPAQNENRRSGARDRGFSHLTYPELLERKQKGLCFKRGGPFHPMHQCPDKQLRVLIVEEGDEEPGREQILAVEVDEDEEEAEGEISVMSFMNLNEQAKMKPQTMMLQGRIHEVPVLILIDSGATHNFIDQKALQGDRSDLGRFQGKLFSSFV